jgi:hypothetical protein
LIHPTPINLTTSLIESEHFDIQLGSYSNLDHLEGLDSYFDYSNHLNMVNNHNNPWLPQDALALLGQLHNLPKHPE